MLLCLIFGIHSSSSSQVITDDGENVKAFFRSGQVCNCVRTFFFFFYDTIYSIFFFAWLYFYLMAIRFMLIEEQDLKLPLKIKIIIINALTNVVALS